jgi:NADH-quinone oxidoreductase subunit K
MLTLAHFITLSALLFSIGVTGVMTRRNALVVLMSIEIMLNASNLALVAFSRYHGGMEGQVLAFFVIALAAAEVTVGLAILIAIYRKQGTIDVAAFRFLSVAKSRSRRTCGEATARRKKSETTGGGCCVRPLVRRGCRPQLCGTPR